MNKSDSVIVVGAGLSGTLLTIRMAQRGHRVNLYEKRSDMRLGQHEAGRSINLALSNRGFRALRMIGMEEEIRQLCIPMKGRLIHDIDGNTRLSPYSGRPNDHINSVSREGLNVALLNMAEKMDNIEIKFDAPCVGASLREGIVRFNYKPENTFFSDKADVIFGADGMGSAIRQSMLKNATALRFTFSQHFLEHGYKELSILPTNDGGWQIEKHALHIWPRGGYMLIALPNLDGSFTVTLFLPFEGENSFEKLQNSEDVLRFFKKNFSDALEVMPNLEEDFFTNPTSSLGTIKCHLWQTYGKTLLIGDAAHAIVPFYGQGMNASFEDVVVLDKVLDSESTWESAFKAYQQLRKKDTDAIADLAIDNFYEMRDHVANETFIKKRQLEMQLEQQFPEYYSKYSMVTFKEEMPYSEAMEKGRIQDERLLELCEKGMDESLDLKEIYNDVALNLTTSP